MRERAWFHRHGVLIQELVPPAGHDLRIIVAGSRIVGASRRDAAPGEWRTNEMLGGRARPVRPSQQACALALDTARVIGIDLASVDLLPTPAGQQLVIEVNAAVDVNDADSLPWAASTPMPPAPSRSPPGGKRSPKRCDRAGPPCTAGSHRQTTLATVPEAPPETSGRHR